MENMISLGEKKILKLKPNSIELVIEFLSAIPLQTKEQIIIELREQKALSEKRVEKAMEMPKKFLCDILEIAQKLLPEDTDNYGRHYAIHWQKSVTGLNKKVENGYSIIGSFLTSPTQLKVGDLILSHALIGKNKPLYQLIQLDSETTAHVIAETKESKWSVFLWEAIESVLKSKKGV